MSGRSRHTGPAAGRRPVGRGAPARPAARPAADSARPGLAARPVTERNAPSSSAAWARGVGLVFIVVMLLVTLVPTLRSYLGQQAQIAALRDQVEAQNIAIDALKAEQETWADPAYVEAQARQRLKCVKVGDRAYTVIDAVPQTATAAGPRSAPVVAATALDSHAPWYGRLWQSVQVADRPTAGMPSSAGSGP